MLNQNINSTLRLLACSILLFLTAVVSACGKDVPQLTKLGSDETIVAFGDSLTYGTGANPSESYPAVLAKLTGHHVIGAGVPGETTEQGVERLPDVIEEYRPKLLILCLGGNDMLRRVSEKEITNNLRTMIRLLQDHGVSVVLLGVPKPALLGGTPEFYEEIAQEFNLPYEGGVIPDVLHDGDLKSDPIHPNAQGYREIAIKVAELLKVSGAL